MQVHRNKGDWDWIKVNTRKDNTEVKTTYNSHECTYTWLETIALIPVAGMNVTLYVFVMLYTSLL